MHPLLLIAASCLLLPTASFARIDPALLRLVPPEMTWIAGIDADRARDSSFGQYMLNRMQTGDASFEQLVKETGFDPRRDLQSFVVSGESEGNKKAGRFAMLGRGIFEESRIKHAALAHGATVQNYNGTELLIHPQSAKNGGQTAGLTFLDSTTAALGDVATLKEILDSRSSAPVAAPPLASAMEKVNAADDVWYVSTMPGMALAAKLPRQTGAPNSSSLTALQGILQSSGGIRLGDVVHFSFNALTRSPEDATALEDLLRLLASMMQMQRNNGPQGAILAQSMDSLALEASGTKVHASVSMTEGNLEKLIESGAHARHTARSERAQRP